MDDFFLTVPSDCCTENFALKFTVFLPTFIQLSVEFEVAVTYVQCPDTKDVYKYVCIWSALVRRQIVNNKFMPVLAVVPFMEITREKAYSPKSSYCQVMQKDFERVEFYIQYFSCQAISFLAGVGTLRLYFRRKS